MNDSLKDLIADYPDFPEPGIIFRDISPILANPAAFRSVIKAMAAEIKRQEIDCLVAIESRGFLFAAPLATEANLPLVLVRKEGKLPGELQRLDYALEYGNAVLELQSNGVKSGQRLAVIDDVLATGGTAAAAGELCRRSGAEVALYLFLIELESLAGRAKLGASEVHSLIKYP
jgi:adenine phosphoribosyltransferase